MKYIKKLYDWVLAWSETKWAVLALFFIAFVESSFFPIPPDVLLIAMALAKPAYALSYATVCTVGSVLGALFGYAIGHWAWQIVGVYFFKYIPGFTPEVFQQVAEKYETHSAAIVFTAAFTPIPYKVFTIAGGVAKVSLIPFVVASIFGRGGRFYLEAILLKIFGEKVKVYIDKYFNLLTLLVVVIYFLAFYLIPKIFGS